MTDKAAYASWEASAREVERIAKDRSLPLWERAHRVGAAYTTVALEGLRSKHRRKRLEPPRKRQRRVRQDRASNLGRGTLQRPAWFRAAQLA